MPYYCDFTWGKCPDAPGRPHDCRGMIMRQAPALHRHQCRVCKEPR